MQADAPAQREELARCQSRLDAAVLEFTKGHARFYMRELDEAVRQAVPSAAPDSGGRILRSLRQRKRLNYEVVNRRQSEYRVIESGRLF